MDEDMADRGDQRRKSHDKGTGTDGCLEFHSQEDRENHQHHHSSAGTDKTRSEADRQAEEKRDRDLERRQLPSFYRSLFTGCIRTDQKTDPDAEGQKQRKSSQHDIPGEPGGVGTDCAHDQDTDAHDLTPLQIDMAVLRVCPGRYR